jgi:hypothetical protein
MVEHSFGTIKARMGATHFLMDQRRARVARQVLACRLTRMMNVIGRQLVAGMGAA